MQMFEAEHHYLEELKLGYGRNLTISAVRDLLLKRTFYRTLKK